MRGIVAFSVIIAGGDVSFAEGTRVGLVTVRAAGNVLLPKKISTTNNDIKDGVKDAVALSPINFFQLSSLGIEVGPSKEGVRVTAAVAGKSFARA